MFTGHFAVGLASKRLAPRASLGPLIAAPILLDLLWPLFVLAGWEQVRVQAGHNAFTRLNFVHYPWSHSLLMSIVWGVLFAVLYYARTLSGGGSRHLRRCDQPLGSRCHHARARHATLAGKIAPARHGAMELSRGDDRYRVADVRRRCSALFHNHPRARDAVGRWSVWTIVLLLAAVYAASVTGPEPPGTGAVIYSALLLWIFPFWSWWADRHRVAASTT